VHRTSSGATVKRAMAEAILGSLTFSGEMQDHTSKLKKFSEREWGSALTWLHDAGLALYFLQKLKNANATDVLPTSTLSRLEKNLAANRRRVASMARQFDRLNQKFDGVGVRYAVVKGFSLVPQFCPDASLRHQSDLDYLIDNQSLAAAQRVVEDAGYSLTKSANNEFVFVMPSVPTPPPADEQYEAHAPHAVELHLAFWGSDSHAVFLAEPDFSVRNVRTHRWQGSIFRALPEEDALLLQVTHAFNHILIGWVRLSWLYEIGFFLKQRSNDTSLWECVDRRIGGDRLLREIVVVVTELCARFFGAPIPSASRIWEEQLPDAVRIWIQNYARPWVFAKSRPDQFSLFSTAKLVLFFHQQYLPDASARRHLVRIRLLPSEPFFQRARSIATKSSANFAGRRQHRVLTRLLFHVTAGLRYLWEIPRWRRLTRVRGTPNPQELA
jgi:hypothetical protein